MHEEKEGTLASSFSVLGDYSNAGRGKSRTPLIAKSEVSTSATENATSQLGMDHADTRFEKPSQRK